MPCALLVGECVCGENNNISASIMDLNVIIEENRVRDSVGVIQQKINRCLRLDLKGIALSVCISGAQIAELSPPIRLDHQVLGLSPKQNFKIYSRLTVAVDDGLQLHKLGHSQTAKQYDLLALQPLNDKVFNQILTNNVDCDIITFDFAEKSSLSFRKANFTVPLEKGMKRCDFLVISK